MGKSKIILITIGVIILLAIGSAIYVKLNNKNQNENKDNLSNEIVDIYDDNIQNISIDTSEKVAKLYDRPNQKYNEKNYLKEISQNELNDINNIIKEGKRDLGIIDYINSADYFLECKDTTLKSIEFRTGVNSIIKAIIDTDESYNIYKAKDVERLKEILNIKDSVEYTTIDIDKIYTPPTLYINSTKIYQSTFSWKQNNSNIINVDMVSPQEMLKDVESVPYIFSPIISTNEDLYSNKLTRLPSNAILQYKIYKGDEIIADEKEAEVMIDGSYHLEIPNILGEYIYVLDLTFEGISGIHSSYCFKCKL